jgi:hypothetical protein
VFACRVAVRADRFARRAGRAGGARTVSAGWIRASRGILLVPSSGSGAHSEQVFAFVNVSMRVGFRYGWRMFSLVFVGIRKVFVGFRGYSVVCLKVFVGIRYNRNGGLTLESGVTACAGGAEQPGRRQARGRAWWAGAAALRRRLPSAGRGCSKYAARDCAVCAWAVAGAHGCLWLLPRLRGATTLSISDSNLGTSALGRSFLELFMVPTFRSMVASSICRTARECVARRAVARRTCRPVRHGWAQGSFSQVGLQRFDIERTPPRLA